MSEHRTRQYRGALGVVARVIAVGLALYALFFTLGGPYYFQWGFHEIQYTSSFMGFMLTLVFLLVPARKDAPRDKLPWYDVLLIIGSLVGSLYITIKYYALTGELASRIWATPLEIVFGAVTVIAVAEAVRRTIGLPMVIIAGVFFFYPRYASFLPGLLGAQNYSWPRLMAYYYFFEEGIFGRVAVIAAEIIMLFMVFAAFLEATGASKSFTDLASALVGRVRGGPAKAAVVGSALVGTLTGSPAANVGLTGVITIPLMKRAGYPAYFAGAVEAVASTGGALMPPVMGAVAFIMADLTGIGYGRIVTAAIIPAVLYFLALFFQVDFRAAKLGLAGLPKAELPSLGKVLKEGWQYFIPILLLLYVLMVLRYRPETAVLYSLAAVIVVSLFRRETRLTPRKVLGALESGSRMLVTVAPICTLIGIVVGSLSASGLGIKLGNIILDASGGNLVFLVLLAGVSCYILGMGVASIVSYIILALVVAPVMVQAGTPLLVAHMFIFYMGLSTFITPPNAGAVFQAMAIARAGANVWNTGYAAMRLGIVTYLVPFIFFFSPAFLLIGSPAEVAVAAVTGVIAVIVLAAGIEGYLFTKARWWQRILFLCGGILLFVPGLMTDIIGAAVLLVPVVTQWLSGRVARSLVKANGGRSPQ